MRTWAIALMLGLVVLAGCTSDGGGATDSDKDGLSDNDERNGWRITVETPNESFEKEVNSDPQVRDTDGDGVDDLFEFALGLDPRNRDTDEDGLTDCQEVFHTVLEDCENPDFDGEGDGGYGTSGSLYDSDAAPSRYVNSHPDLFSHRLRGADGLIERGDGVSDGQEINGFTIDLPGGRQRNVTTAPMKVDTDGDSLEDGEELFLYGTDPTVADTDGDGCEDGFDPIPDRDEYFSIGLDQFTWDEPGRSGSTEVVFFLSVADRQITVPEPDALVVEHGEPVDLAPHGHAPVKALHCSYTPGDAFVRIDIQVAEFKDGEYQGPIDVQSKTVPEKFSLWWNVADDRYRWELRGADVAAEDALVWEGTDGRIVFQPDVVFK